MMTWRNFWAGLLAAILLLGVVDLHAPGDVLDSLGHLQEGTYSASARHPGQPAHFEPSADAKRPVCPICLHLLRTSGVHLVAVRGLIEAAAGPDDVSALWSWLAAGRVPGGPDLDSRLRWQILLRLTVLGAASRAEIEHDADRDATAAGQLSAARCRAALPDDDAKQAAWAAMLSRALSGYELTATAQGFWQADQAELLAGYVPRYFAALAEAAAAGTAGETVPPGASGLVRTLCRHGFPHHAADAATVRAGELCLATGALAGSVRRLLADQLEDLRRSVAVRSAG